LIHLFHFKEFAIKKLNNKNKLNAFTLIELLITIGIIIILIGISTPQVLSYINRTKMTRAQMDMNTVKTALMAYFHDWGEYPSTLKELLLIPPTQLIVRQISLLTFRRTYRIRKKHSCRYFYRAK